MDAVTVRERLGEVAEPRARIGLIIPSVNRMTEPQFNRFAPAGLGVHVARGRVAGGPPRTVAELTDEITHAADTLADAKPDLIVFHCTYTSMKEGADGEARILNLIRKTTGIEAVSTSQPSQRGAARAEGEKGAGAQSLSQQCRHHRLSQRGRLHRGQGRRARLRDAGCLRSDHAAALV